MKKTLRLDYQFSQRDIDALISALPLVPLLQAKTDVQQVRNTQLSISVGKKLLSRDRSISPEEFRVMAVAVEAALAVLSDAPSLEYLASKKVPLQRHSFTFHHLHAVFDPVVEQLQ